MTRELFGHPFSSYTWKALIALYETDTPFTFRDISGHDLGDVEDRLNLQVATRVWKIVLGGPG